MRSERLVSIVDDDESVRHATGNLIRSFGQRIRLFESAEAFLRPDLIADTKCLISDVMMPTMSGVAMYERMLLLGYSPPTIFITAFPAAELKAQALTNGALVVLEKPVDVDAIAYWLNIALD